MEVRACARYVRISPRKARLVIDLIRGKRASEALNILKFTNKKAARIVAGVLRSAIGNASQETGIDIENLYVKRAYVDVGPMWKRYRPRAMGRVTMIRKRTSHITVVLDEE